MRIFSVFLFLAFFGSVFSQNPISASQNFWQKTSARALPADVVRANRPTEAAHFSLDLEAMRARLFEAPHEDKTRLSESSVIVDLPMPDGSTEAFRVVWAPIFSEKMAKKFPEIRTFSVQSVSRPAVWGKMDIGALGLHASIFVPFLAEKEPMGTVLIDPVAVGDLFSYQVFDRKKVELEARTGEIIFPEFEKGQSLPLHPTERLAEITTVSDRGPVLAPVVKRRYAFALSLASEYTALTGGTVATAMAAATNAVNRFNGIFERDFAMRFDMVDNIDTLFYFDAVNDPYPASNVPTMAQNNQDVTDLRIGAANYDAGHVFNKFISGNILGIAGGRVCTGNKAKAASTDSNPLSDNFIVTVCQEIEHQFAARHTWNRCGDPTDPNTPSAQYHEESAFEPGSGSTIVSYGGGCGGDNVQGTADDYNHSWSIEQVKFFNDNDGQTCVTNEPTNNAQPTASIPTTGGFFIPRGTPFQLTGVASDPDGDALTYLWEQMDLGPQSPLGSPQGTAPLMRSFPASTSLTRIFPQKSLILQGLTSQREVLPSIDRPLNFRFTVLDNHAGAGGQTWAEIAFRCHAAAGPFKVQTANSTGVVWKGGEFQQVKWDVAGSDLTPVNCKKVNIRLSMNAGQTFDILLAADEANDGQAWVQVPMIVSSQCRIWLEAADNIFFDINDKNFSIQNPTAPAMSMAVGPDAGAICAPGSFFTTVQTAGIGGFSDNIALTATGLPAGMTATFGQPSVTPGGNSSLLLEAPNGTAEGDYVLKIVGTAGATVVERELKLKIVSNDFAGVALQSPADGSAAQPLLPTFSWATVADANSYDWQIAENPSFSTTFSEKTGLTTGSTEPTATLAEGKQYFWRVRPVNECGAGAWVGPFSLGTQALTCLNFENATTQSISASGSPTVDSKISANFAGAISDVNILKIVGQHEFFKDLEGHLISPSGTDVLLWKSKCGNFNGTFKFGFDDEASADFSCPPTSDQTRRPDATGLKMNAFKGQNAQGDWTLRIKDNTSSSGGQLTSWKLEICASASANPPVLIKNNAILVGLGQNEVVSNADLQVTDPNNGPGQLVFTLVSVPRNGDLRLNWTAAMKVGDTFTQADIDAGAVRYFNWGATTGDDFKFTVIDGEGGYIGTTKFIFSADPTGASEAENALAFSIAPNPASDFFVLERGDFSAASEVEIFAATGQLVRRSTAAAGEKTTTVSMASLPSGVWFVAVRTGAARGVKRLVKE